MSERATVPHGKSIFYHSPGRNATGAQMSEDANLQNSEACPKPIVASDLAGQKLALYDRLSDGIQLALSNALRLLDLANQTRSAAWELADQMIAEAQQRQRKLIRENEYLANEQDELRRKVSEAREQVNREEVVLRDLAERRQALQSEIEELERRRRQAIEAVQAQLSAINRLQESLVDDAPSQDR